MSIQKASLEKKTKNTLFSTKNVKKSHKIAKFVLICAIFWFVLFLCGCAKTAPEAATEAALAQTSALHQQI